jgi:hypothetical protein
MIPTKTDSASAVAGAFFHQSRWPREDSLQSYPSGAAAMGWAVLRVTLKPSEGTCRWYDTLLGNAFCVQRHFCPLVGKSYASIIFRSICHCRRMTTTGCGFCLIDFGPGRHASLHPINCRPAPYNKIWPHRRAILKLTYESSPPRNDCITTCWRSRLLTSARESRGAFLLVVEPSRRGKLQAV